MLTHISLSTLLNQKVRKQKHLYVQPTQQTRTALHTMNTNIILNRMVQGLCFLCSYEPTNSIYCSNFSLLWFLSFTKSGVLSSKHLTEFALSQIKLIIVTFKENHKRTNGNIRWHQLVCRSEGESESAWMFISGHLLQLRLFCYKNN